MGRGFSRLKESICFDVGLCKSYPSFQTLREPHRHELGPWSSGPVYEGLSIHMYKQLRIGSCLACLYRVMNARGKLGEHERSVKVGSHEGTCCRDMSRGRISCAVHTKGHVAGIGFLKCSHRGSCRRDMSWFRFLIGLFSEVSRGHVAWTVHTRRPCV